MTENEIAREIVDACYHVHRALGPGLLESVYEAVLSIELEKRSLPIQRQHPIAITYEGQEIGPAFKADLIVGNKVIVEIKSVSETLPVHRKQLGTYLKLSGKRLGLLINFNVVLIKDGVTRVANGMED